jgi:acetyl esterase/lipase
MEETMALDSGTENAFACGATTSVRALEVRGEQGPLAARLYRAAPEQVRCETLIVYFHGGYFIGGDLDDSDAFLRQLAATNPQHAVLAADYTLAPERPFPAAAEDAYAVLVWAKKNKTRLGWTGRHLMVAGIEAGANLATVAAQICIDRKGPALACQILIMPMLDSALSTRSMRESAISGGLAGVAEMCAAGYRRYLPNAADRCHPYASPSYSSRLGKLPAALILSSRDDPLRDEAEQYGMRLIASGVPTTVRRLPTLAGDTYRRRLDGVGAALVHAEIASFIAIHSHAPAPALPH